MYIRKWSITIVAVWIHEGNDLKCKFWFSDERSHRKTYVHIILYALKSDIFTNLQRTISLEIYNYRNSTFKYGTSFYPVFYYYLWKTLTNFLSAIKFATLCEKYATPHFTQTKNCLIPNISWNDHKYIYRETDIHETST